MGRLTATDVGGKLACVLIKLHPPRAETDGEAVGWGEGGLVVIINVVQSKWTRTKKHPLCSEQAP